ncbi:MAG TPA: S8 family serine peptidase [Candidatus Thermoplasmatota archaeon]|nr:S8 family serine peptidase [Candidatus Thermoplasmatota archaeon]
MRAVTILTLALVVLSATAVPLPAATATPEPAGPERYIIAFHEAPGPLAPGGALYGAPIVTVNEYLPLVVVETTNPAALQAAALADSNVRLVERDGVVRHLGANATYTPNDSRYNRLYALPQIKVPQAWDTTKGDPGVSVCVLDTGVRYTHEDLTGARYRGGYDYVNRDADPWDDEGHGTHVTGIAVATMDNGKGIAGVAQASFYHVKVLAATGSGYFSDVANGITWCANNAGSRVVISMSLGALGASGAVDYAASYAFNEKGALLVAAAGNDGVNCGECVNHPADSAHVIAVTCTKNGGGMCSYSSVGSTAEVAAPGDNILSTLFDCDTCYGGMSGTSMSTPHVAGVAALVWSAHPEASNERVRRVLQASARDLGTVGWDPRYGHGEVDAAAALTVGAMTPGVPRNLRTEGGVDRIRVQWDAPRDDGNSPIQKYRVFITDDKGTTVVREVPGTTREHTETGYLPGTMRYFRVSAVNALGEGAKSGLVTGSTLSLDIVT